MVLCNLDVVAVLCGARGEVYRVQIQCGKVA